MTTPLGWLAHELMTLGRSIDAQSTYILVGKRMYYSRNKIALWTVCTETVTKYKHRD